MYKTIKKLKETPWEIFALGGLGLVLLEIFLMGSYTLYNSYKKGREDHAREVIISQMRHSPKGIQDVMQNHIGDFPTE